MTDTLTTIGGGQQEQVNVASIYVKMTPIEERKVSQQELMVRARNEVLGKYLKQYPGQLRTSVQQVAAISGGGFRNSDIQYVLGGPDLNKLQEYSDKLLEKMKTIPDVVDVDSTLISGKPELRVVIDRARAADLGVRVGDIAQALNSLVAGQKVSTFNAGTDQYDVRVRSVGEFRTSVEGLQRMIVSSTKVGWVSLDNLVKIEEGTGPCCDRSFEPATTGDVARQRATGRFTGRGHPADGPICEGDQGRSGLHHGSGGTLEGAWARGILLRAGVHPLVCIHVHGAGGAV